MKTKSIFLVVYCLALAIQSCTSDYTKNLGNKYFYRFEASDLRDIGCKRPNGGEIPADVISYAFDSQFIIAKQKPKLPQDPLYNRDYEYHNGESALYFWIILKEKDIVFGPMNKTEFTTKTKELDINLKFEECQKSSKDKWISCFKTRIE